MRRFSHRHSLVTLSEINITPLLDLAFVLLIIFMITMPPLIENAMDLNLPQGGESMQTRNQSDIRLVEVTPEGDIYLDKSLLTLDEIDTALIQFKQSNPDVTVDFRGDSNSLFKYAARVFDICTRNEIAIAVRFRKEEP